jgi:tyrosyl-tRNA synthetase
VERLHGGEAAARAEADWERQFRQRELPEEVPERAVTNPSDVTGLLVDLGWYPSRSAARRVVEQNGVRVNGQKIGLDHVLRDGDVLQAGRRNIVRVRVG